MVIDSRNLQKIFRVSPVPSVLRCHDWRLARFTAVIWQTIRGRWPHPRGGTSDHSQ